jgi:phage terminase small subunit
VNRRERRFVLEYALDANAARAAARAGYSPRYAVETAHGLMRRPTIRFAIEQGWDARMGRTGATKERVLLELARIGLSDLARIVQQGPQGIALVPAALLADDDAAAIMGLAGAPRPGGTIRVRLHDKGFALDMLARYFGLDDEIESPADARSPREILMEKIDAYARRAEAEGAIPPASSGRGAATPSAS